MEKLTRNRVWLESACLRAVRSQRECRDIERIRIGRAAPNSTEWIPVEFVPLPHRTAEERGREEIAKLQRAYALGKD